LRGLSIAAAAALLALVATMPLGMTGCADQGEGQRCTFFMGGDAGENGTSECASGLLCVPYSDYFTAATTAAGTLGVCCPPSGTMASVAVCQAMVGGSMTGGRPVGDGGFDATKADGASVDGAPTGDAHHTDAHASDAHDDGNGADARPDTAPATGDAAHDVTVDAAHAG